MSRTLAKSNVSVNCHLRARPERAVHVAEGVGVGEHVEGAFADDLHRGSARERVRGLGDGLADADPAHADRPADKLDEAVIPVLSLGATRRFLIKPDRGGRSTVITTHGGDLVVMGGRCQKDYKHSVPKQRVVAGPRLSLNFSAQPPRPPVAAKGRR